MSLFVYRRRLHFYETDAMGIVHHAIYFYLLEEARTDFLRQKGVLPAQGLEQINYPVLDAQMQYKKSLYFDDEVEISVQLQFEKARLIFQYEMRTKRFSEPVAFGKTVHVAMDMKTRRPMKLPEALRSLLQQ